MVSITKLSHFLSRRLAWQRGISLLKYSMPASACSASEALKAPRPLVKATVPFAGTTTFCANGMSVSTPAANECTYGSGVHDYFDGIAIDNQHSLGRYKVLATTVYTKKLTHPGALWESRPELLERLRWSASRRRARARNPQESNSFFELVRLYSILFWVVSNWHEIYPRFQSTGHAIKRWASRTDNSNHRSPVGVRTRF